MILAFDNSATSQVARAIAKVPARTASSSSVCAGDTITKNRWTIDFGVRYDRQWGKALPSDIASNAGPSERRARA